MSELSKVEYRVVPVDRYIITRYASGANDTAGCEGRGEYDNADVAYEVAYALAKAEHDRLGWPAFDDRMQYPQHPRQGVPVTDGRVAEVAAACAGVPVINSTL